MSIHLHSSDVVENFDDNEDIVSSSSDEDEDETWDDWVSESGTRQICRSLFDDKTLPSVEGIRAYDKAAHGFDLDVICKKLSLDVHGRIRLINFIRQTKPAPGNVEMLKGTESFFKSDEFLRPVIEDDPLLQYQPDDWVDSDDEDAELPPERRIRALGQQLSQAKRDFEEYRNLTTQRFDLSSFAEGPSQLAQPAARDDDSHYFESYGANDIHAVMIQDKVRTSTYARYILTTPSVFEGTTVLDVGCGTGILSLFAARAGAKRVFAVDASDIATKAEKIVKANGLDNIITVIRGKVEDIQLPEGVEKVDVIISEWMGYALLYESMLDSVLVARDRWLKPGGVMAPSQCKMMLGLCDASEIVKDRMTFWSDIYGFDLSVMAEEVPDEAIIDVVGPRTMLSAPYTIKDLYLPTITSRQLDFTSSFSLTSTVERRTKVTSFILYFDTFFTRTGEPVPPDTKVNVIGEDEAVVAEVWPVGGKDGPQRRASHHEKMREKSVDAAKEKERLKEKEKEEKAEVITSFSTGPQSIPTHWKQTLFLLREPFIAEEGSVVHGQFYCHKSSSNSRELDVEIHYAVKDREGKAVIPDVVVQIFKVR